MLVSAGGGGAGGTPWGMLTMQQMQELIQNPDTEKHYELLTGWKKSADLLVEHRWQVKNYRDNLAAVWPPNKNAASEAYLARLDELIHNLSETYEAALANHDAFAAATLSISLAQKQMAEIAREYESNDQLLATHTAKQQSTAGQPQPTPSPSPSGEQPPVAPGRQEALHQKAVLLLSGVSGDLATAQMSIRTPTLYSSNFKDSAKELNGGDTYTAPPIPPISPDFADDRLGAGKSSRPSARFPTNEGSVPPPPSATPPIQQPGLILGGATPSPNSNIPSPSVGAAASITPTGPNPVVSTGLFSPGLNGSKSIGGNPTIAPGTNGASRTEGTLRPGSVNTNPINGSRPLPPGGVIGGIPGGGLGRPGSSRPVINRVNPIGGIIGESITGRTGTPGVSAGGGIMGGPQYGSANGRQNARTSPSETRWDPDNPWQIDEGVDPVVLPPGEQRIDPGPAIGLR